MKKSIIFFLHLGYWLLYSLLLTAIFAMVGFQSRKNFSLETFAPLAALCVAPNLLAFYGFYLLLFTKFLARRKFFALTLSGVLICLLAAVSGELLAAFIFGFRQPIFTDTNEFAALFATLFTVAAIHGIIALVIKGFVSWFDEIKLKEELAQKTYETEIALIKSQINPHFLFNTINNIDVLISKDGEKASAYLNKLSGILRYMVYETNAEKIALGKELSYLEKYLELQKIRTTNADYVKFEIAGDAKNLEIAPMILFPFIENAFKHTENRKNASSIKIRASIENRRLIFTCENSYQNPVNAKQNFGGLGNELIKKRLNLLYPEKHSLEIADDGANYKVKLTIDLDGE